MSQNENPENENQNESNSDENFGLPDLDFKPLESTEESSSEATAAESTEESSSVKSKEYTYAPVEEPSSKAPLIIGIIIALVIVVGGFLVYKFVYVPRAEKAKRELAEKKEAEERKKREEEEARIAREKEEAERKRLAEEQANAKPAEGTIEALSARTGRYYVVVTSAIDGDLTMDYAKKLSATGVSVSIIPPFGKSKFNRLAIGSYDTFAEAQTNADAAKATYGDAVWVVKY